MCWQTNLRPETDDNGLIFCCICTYIYTYDKEGVTPEFMVICCWCWYAACMHVRSWVYMHMSRKLLEMYVSYACSCTHTCVGRRFGMYTYHLYVNVCMHCESVCVFVYTYTLTYTHIHTHIRIYMHTYIHNVRLTCHATHTEQHSCNTCGTTYIYKHIHTQTYTLKYTHTHYRATPHVTTAEPHTYTLTHIHTQYTHTHTHITERHPMQQLRDHILRVPFCVYHIVLRGLRGLQLPG
jgi:hypothetical protein